MIKTISVTKPTPIDNKGIDKLFNRSRAITEAVSSFWEMRLAKTATLGNVRETSIGYDIDILYRQRRR